MRRVVLALGLVCGLLLLTPTAAFACSCKAFTLTEKVQATDTVLDATLTWSTTNGIETSYGLDVTEVFKGKAAEFEKVRTNANEASCGAGDLVEDKRYLFFLDGEHPGQMRTNLCLAPVAYDAAVSAEVEGITGAPTGPFVNQPTQPGPVDDDQIAGTSVGSVLGTTAVIALVLGGLVYLRKRS